jgi:predicted Zn-dependent protease
MPSEKDASERPARGRSGCELKSLQRRSQADFEIEFFEQILHRDPENVPLLAALGALFAEKGWYRRAVQVDERLVQLLPFDPIAAYNLACSLALASQPVKSVRALERAVVCGFHDVRQIETDPDLESLRARADYQELCRGMRVRAQGTNA